MLCSSGGFNNEKDNGLYINCGKDRSNSQKDDIETESGDGDNGFSIPGSAYIGPEVIKPEDDDNGFDEEEKQTDIAINHKSAYKSIGQFLFQCFHFLRNNKFAGRFILISIIIIFLLSLTVHQIPREFDVISPKALEIKYDSVKNKTYLFNTRGKLLHTIDVSLNPLLYTPDKSAVVLGSKRYDTRLYYANADKVIMLKDIITLQGMSDNGRYIFYSLKDNNKKLFLKRYDTRTGKNTMIASYQSENSHKDITEINVCLSPDGKTYSITKIIYRYHTSLDTNTYNIKVEAFVSIDGRKPKLIGRNKYVYAISNNGNYIYYIVLNKTGNSGKYYVKCKEDSLKLSDEPISCFFNRDYSEILYGTGKGTYLCLKGRNKINMSDLHVVNVILPNHDINNQYMVKHFGIDSFLNKIIQCNKSLYLIENGYHLKFITKIDKNSLSMISQDGKNLLYQNSQGLIVKVSNIPGNLSKKTIAEDVSNYVASKDLSKIYYISRENKLFFRNNDKSPVNLASGVTKLCLNPPGNTAFFINNNQNLLNTLTVSYRDVINTLSYSINGQAPKPVRNGASADDFVKFNYGIAFKKEVNGKQNIYYNTSGTDFKLILRDFHESEDSTNINIVQ